MKKLILLLLTSVSLYAAESVTSVSALTANNVGSSNNWVITRVAWLANATNAIVKFYDTGSTATNIVHAAYTTRLSYSTNFVTTFTNTVGVIQTNTFAGIFTQDLNVAAVTNEAPQILVMTIPANAKVERYVNLHTIKGLNVYSTAAGNLELTYKPGF